jgi:hypothetical protein
MRTTLTPLERRQTREALDRCDKHRPKEYRQSDVVIGRARERQLIAEAEREAARSRERELGNERP